MLIWSKLYFFKLCSPRRLEGELSVIYYIMLSNYRIFLITKNINIAQLVQNLKQFWWIGGFCIFVELNQEGLLLSASLHGSGGFCPPWSKQPNIYPNIEIFQISLINGRFLSNLEFAICDLCSTYGSYLPSFQNREEGKCPLNGASNYGKLPYHKENIYPFFIYFYSL